VSDKSLNEYFEAVNHQEAIHYKEHLVQPEDAFRERDILQVHELVMDRINKDFACGIRHAGV
jgi:Fic family protein